MGEHDRVVVHIHHPRVRRSFLRDLVQIRFGRDVGADVEEPPDTQLTKVVYRTYHERTIVPGHGPNGGNGLLDIRGSLSIGRVVVLAAQK